MSLTRTKVLVRPRRVRQIGEEVGQRRSDGESAGPLLGGAGQDGEFAVGGHDVDVAGVEGRDGDGAAPGDEVVGVFADLAVAEDVALADLVESS